MKSELYSDGVSVASQTLANPTADAIDTIASQAKNAIQSNDNFLANASPNNAAILQQVQRLTRQCNGLIKQLLLNQMTDTSDV